MPIFNGLNRCNSCGCHVSEPHSPQCSTQCVSLMYQRAQISRAECCAWQLCTSAALVWRVGNGQGGALEAFGYCAEHAPIVAQALVTYGREVAWCGCSNCLNGLNQPAPVVCVSESRRGRYPTSVADGCCACEARDRRTVWITREDCPNTAWRYHAECAAELLAEQERGYPNGVSVCPCAQCSPAAPAQAVTQPAAAVFAPRVERVKGRGLVGVAVYL